MKIGLEVHVALPTKSKLFCSCSSISDEPNSAICPICMGFPGSKPMLNGAALSQAINVANALNCKISESTSFVRKVYFYPDLPKSYQITQTQGAIGGNGSVELESKRIGIRRIQLEEDPAKIVREENYTLIDFNRSGIPLVEIVTEPDISSEEELREFVFALKSILYYLGIDIEKELKVDLNISVAKERVEIKNVTGLRNLIDAARYEIKRQQELVAKKQKVESETRSYNEKAMRTESSREKESDEEYGFIYDPDLTSYSTKSASVQKPVYAGKIAREYGKKYGGAAKTILELIQFDKRSLELIDYAKAKWPMQNIINVVEVLKKYGHMGIPDEKFTRLIEIAKSGTPVNEQVLKQVIKGAAVETSNVGSTDIDKEIKAMIKANQKLLKEYDKNPKVFNFIIGEVAKKLKANPKDVSARLSSILEKI